MNIRPLNLFQSIYKMVEALLVKEECVVPTSED
jgi:hypothetical protein